MSLNNEHNKNLKHMHLLLNPVARLVKSTLLVGVAGTFTFSAYAQQAQQQEQAEEEAGIEIISVTGSRKTIQNQISIKREATTVVVGLSAEDIVDLPALSIG